MGPIPDPSEGTIQALRSLFAAASPEQLTRALAEVLANPGAQTSEADSSWLIPVRVGEEPHRDKESGEGL
jgi:hypothetical protein